MSRRTIPLSFFCIRISFRTVRDPMLTRRQRLQQAINRPSTAGRRCIGGPIGRQAPFGQYEADRAFLAASLHRLPRKALCRLRLLVRPDTIVR